MPLPSWLKQTAKSLFGPAPRPDYRELYGGMSDLADVALKCYDKEAERRSEVVSKSEVSLKITMITIR